MEAVPEAKPTNPANPKIKESLLEALKKKKRVDIIVCFTAPAPEQMVDVDLNKVTVEAVPDNNETKEEEHVAIAEKDNEEEPVPDVEASDKEKDEPLDDHSENKENPPDAAAASGEDSERKPSETSSHLEESMSAVIDLLENNTKRLNLTWKLMVITNMISVNGVDSKLVEEIAAVENVAYVEEAGAVKTSGKEPKIWKKLKSVWKSKK